MKAVSTFKALSDSTRLRILNLVSQQELNVNEIVKILETSQSGISRHLKILTEAALIQKRKDGLWSFYSVPHDTHLSGLLQLLPEYLENEKAIKEDNTHAEIIIRQRSQDSIRLFDSLAPHWETMKKELFGTIDINQKIVAAIKDHPVVCADLGCGTGDLIDLLRKKSVSIIGVDSSPEMVQATRKRFASTGGKVDIRIGELEHLPLKEAEADSVVCNIVLHHLPDPKLGLHEVRRILAKNGRLIVADLYSHTSEKMRTRFGDRWLGFKKEEIHAWLSQSGFTITREQSVPIQQELTVFVINAEKQYQEDIRND